MSLAISGPQQDQIPSLDLTETCHVAPDRFGMRVIKRSGEYEIVNFEKIAQRLRKLCWGLSNVDIESVVAAVATNMVDEISTERLDILAADLCIARDTEHPDFGVLASRIAVSNLQKMTSDSIVETFERMRGVVSDEFLDRVNANAEDLQAMVCYSRDYDFDYFGVETLKKLYCGRVNEILVERPQHMYLRVSLAICGGEGDMARVKKTYDMMSTKMFTHASPTLFNAGMKTQQCSSCFLQTMGDSLDGIFGCIHDAARISKHGGGLGISISDVRSKGAPIRGTNGKSDGILPLLKVVNSVASYINQGGRRKGSAAMYLEPHHPDIFEFLDLKRPGGDEDLRCRDLFMALWVSDLFMKRVRAGSDWSLMDPSLCPGLSECHGAAFETLYAQYESEGRASRVVKARDLWNAILRAQTESGVPYILYKDAANSKSNQSSLGTIKSSNLCAEIIEFTSDDEVAVCTLASLGLPAFVKRGGRFDYAALHEAVRVVARNLDDVIDINAYPMDKARRSSQTHRPIGIGIQGLADVFAKLRIPFDSPEAARLNAEISATMYHAALDASADLAAEKGAYASFEGSPASRGQLQWDLWGIESPETVGGTLDWTALKSKIERHGLRNSLSIALMPTASTAQVFGNNESFEPFTSLIYTRRTLAGEFVVINRHLVRDLVKLRIWSPLVKNAIIRDAGSIQNVPEIPDDIKKLYRTVWELPQRVLVDQSAARGPYVCQSQSLNIFFERPTFEKLTALHMHGWKSGLKTGSYYIRSKPASHAARVTVDAEECVMCSA